MGATTIFNIILVIISVNFILEQILDLLNYRSLNPELPDRLKGFYDTEKYSKSVAYNKVKDRLGFITSLLSFGILLIVLVSGFFGTLDHWLRFYFENEIYLALAFFGVLFIASDLLNLPFQLYNTFVVEEKYGFNKMTIGTFFADKLKGYFLGALIGGGMLAALLYLIIIIGANFWIYFWAGISLFMLFANIFYTSLIVPLFNKLTPLEEGELRSGIKAYCESVDFPLENIYVIDGSKRSTKANAFFSGMGKKKKIVMYDTLIEKHTTEELIAVFAHEVGHYKKKHILTGYVLSIIQTGIMLFIMSKMIFSESLSQALGAEQLGMHLNLLAFGLLYSPVSLITGLMMNTLSRKNEYEADAFASVTYAGKPLQDALKKLSVDNLSNLLPHPWYVFFHYSHPTVLQRLRAIDQLEKDKS